MAERLTKERKTVLRRMSKGLLQPERDFRNLLREVLDECDALERERDEAILSVIRAAEQMGEFEMERDAARLVCAMHGVCYRCGYVPKTFMIDDDSPALCERCGND